MYLIALPKDFYQLTYKKYTEPVIIFRISQNSKLKVIKIIKTSTSKPISQLHQMQGSMIWSTHCPESLHFSYTSSPSNIMHLISSHSNINPVTKILYSIKTSYWVLYGSQKPNNGRTKQPELRWLMVANFTYSEKLKKTTCSTIPKRWRTALYLRVLQESRRLGRKSEKMRKTSKKLSTSIRRVRWEIGFESYMVGKRVQRRRGWYDFRRHRRPEIVSAAEGGAFSVSPCLFGSNSARYCVPFCSVLFRVCYCSISIIYF